MTGKRFPWGKLIFFVTGNVHKFNETLSVLAEYDIATAMLKMKPSEIQDDDTETIAKAGALYAANRSHLPVIVEDSGLFVYGLKGFPGPYSKHVYRTIGKEGVLKLLGNRRDRKASFRSVIAFCSPDGLSKCFHGLVEGSIVKKIRGSSGFGFDPIFAPIENPEKTFGEMTAEEKNRISHRARTLRKFAEWYK
jgi:XTP/dITP diphosphohydrolase